jgi:hypothetical protein
MRNPNRLLGSLLAVASLWLTALAGDPIVSVTRFKNLPSRISYFEDTTVSYMLRHSASSTSMSKADATLRILLDEQTVLMHDPQLRNVHVSSDEGASWTLAPGIPENQVVRLVEHPFGHNMAFALGKEETHWVTYNRGESWQEWVMSVQGREASLGGDVLSFHAEKSGELWPSSVFH